MIRTAIALSGLFVVLCSSAAMAGPTSAPDQPKANPALLAQPPNVWVKIHEQKPGDAVRFSRQEHGGSCFDSKRGRLILFGSNTHGKDWLNSPLLFDPANPGWTRLYPDDDFKTYAVNDAGLPVAGEKGDHPWTTHTFGSLVYDASRDEMIDVCFPGHMEPGRFTNVMKDLWPKVKMHPTWTFDLAKQVWRPLPCKAEHFFPNCAAYDSGRKSVLGYRGDGVWELGGEPRQWKRLTGKTFLGGYHNNCAYDSKNKALVVFGTNANSNDIEAFWPATGEHKLMPTPGARPAKDQHNPTEFEPNAGLTAVIVDRALDPAAKEKSKVQAETWLYDLAKDAWTQITTATLPFAVGMNFNMEYDPTNKCLLLVTGGVPTVWALRVDAGKVR